MRITCMIRSLTLGGAERQLTGLAVMLKAAGHDVEVLTYHEADFYARTLQEAGVTHTFIPKDGSSVGLERRITEHFKAWRPDVVIAFLTGPCVKACHVHKRFPHFRLIVSERNVNTWTGPHDLWRMLVFREADLIVTNSHAQEAYLRHRFPFIASRLRTIVNFVDTDAFSPAPGTSVIPGSSVIPGRPGSPQISDLWGVPDRESAQRRKSRKRYGCTVISRARSFSGSEKITPASFPRSRRPSASLKLSPSAFSRAGSI